jgi:hypothetical protein
MSEPNVSKELAFMCECCGEVEIFVGDKFIQRANDEKHSEECFYATDYLEKYDDYGVYIANKEGKWIPARVTPQSVYDSRVITP